MKSTSIDKLDGPVSVPDIGYITIKKIDDCENIHSVNLLYFLANHANGYINGKIEINT